MRYIFFKIFILFKTENRHNSAVLRFRINFKNQSRNFAVKNSLFSRAMWLIEIDLGHSA
jgi:hypothetical protein